jgi:hypothetical protein
VRAVAKWFSRAMWGLLLVIVAVVAVGAFVLPERTNVTSNADDLDWRRLNPITTTTGLSRPTTTFSVQTETVRPATDGNDWFLVVDGARAYRIPRTAMTARLLWLATAIAE